MRSSGHGNGRTKEETIREQAAELIVGDESDVDETLGRWLSNSPKHVEEYLQMSALWEVLADPRLAADERQIARRPATRRQWRVGPIAAAATLLFLVVGWVSWLGRDGKIHRTAVGEVTSFTLTDRSVVFMNADSELSVRYSAEERKVMLISGEAAFEVAHDPRRPFVVQSGATRVFAVGTKFVARRLPGLTTVTVLEGHVVVEGAFALARTQRPEEAQEPPRPPGGSPGGVTLGPSQRLEVEDSGRALTATVHAQEPASWQERRLVFDSERLDAVGAAFNRFDPTAITIDDRRLSAVRISGVFKADDPDSFLDFLRSLDGIVVWVGPDGRATVRSAGSEPR